uniref:copine-5-like n=1 Tax=Panthera onca TaxID=9690 RepID=UPI00295406B3
MGSQGKGCGRREGGQRQGAAWAAWSQRQPFPCSHDFIGEFTTSYRELARGQSQFNIYEVVNPKKKMKKKKYVNSGT